MKSFACLFLLAGTTLCRAETPADPWSQVMSLLGDARPPDVSNQALTLEDVERIALSSNPEMEVAARRVAIAESRVPQAGALDDPSAMYRAWGVPLSEPWNYNAAQNMFSISQTMPWPGKRALRTSVADSSVAIAKAQWRQTRLEIQVRVRKAFDDLVLAQNEMRIHDQHVGIARQAIEAARIQYSVGRVPQQDILKAQVALTRLAEHMIRFDQDAELARARMNTLMGRDPSAPLRAAATEVPLEKLPVLAELESQTLTTRPDLVELREEAERSRRTRTLARQAYLPDMTFSGGYMLMPSGSAFRNNYMAEASINLPWLNHRKHDSEIAEAGAMVSEQDAELSAARNSAFGQIEEALVHAVAAQKLARVYHDELRPQAEATLQSSVIAYENNKTGFLDLLDSQMTVVDVDLAWLQAISDFEKSLADLQLATGVPIGYSDFPEGKVKP